MYDPKEPADEEAEKARQEIERQRYEKIMSTEGGRWVLWQILCECGTFNPPSAEREMGAQAAGMCIRDTLRDTNLLFYHQMIVENDR